ncbi:RloB family protein [Streptomyces sp. NPDC058691]|uniref:RloB family protein n=1 Tax=Streptomyces sp. NPDC058691 TaxID=3346601 RepID=UPI003661BFF9
MAGVRREISPNRKVRAVRNLNKRILVVCGAEKTEKQYLEGLRDSKRKANIAIKIRIEATDPLAVVRAAVRYRDTDKDAFDECWVVIDVDEFDLRPANKLAQREGIRIALSNPCFEYWLLLHFCAHNGYVESYKKLELMLDRYIGGYDKTRLDFRLYEPHIPEAVERSIARIEKCGNCDTNPSTSVHEIVMQFMN